MNQPNKPNQPNQPKLQRIGKDKYVKTGDEVQNKLTQEDIELLLNLIPLAPKIILVLVISPVPIVAIPIKKLE